MQLGDLKSLLKLLRSQGVTQYTTPELTLVLSDVLPQKEKKAQGFELPEERELSYEERLFYSAGTLPEEPPAEGE